MHANLTPGHSSGGREKLSTYLGALGPWAKSIPSPSLLVPISSAPTETADKREWNHERRIRQAEVARNIGRHAENSTRKG